MKKIKWFFVLSLIAFVGAFLVACSSESSTNASKEASSEKEEKQPIEVNIGIQQSIWPILAAKEKGWFEEEFEKAGAKVNWVEFQSGPAYFEAIATDRLDFGRVGNIPVLVGQAADIPFKEIALASSGEKGDAILIPKDSPIKSVKDLKGKKVAVAKGSSSYGLLYRALEANEINPEDVEIIQLQPDEAQPAFETGSVDAWVIWEPFQSIQVVKNGAKVLANGVDVNTSSPGFQIVRTKFAEEHPELVELYLKVTEKATRWQNENLEEAIELYAELKDTDQEVIRQVLENSQPSNTPITEEVVEEQQKTTKLLYDLGGIKKTFDASEVVDNSYIENVLKDYK
ncbi:aliphatic sulfonate ABC transporter substrate-binding protein [Robertmurraya korlensis]|uniref:aliphatic sulfonate ABC transporter substrate-binding protein n=1 Tax=Robertmurraya korlensis TaxID=519977 RepID=UPI00203C382D|nr:aliphatic sulfonate ABC transporter substrate-binding protein [Robertmurraya korlensis]MCM3601176.1 aliphatic sulfonate ABC transporter substrate-binding protein [Robertmurraya korlensis]